ncbi:hypothetical protein EDD15DRAFT_1380783 [Pisolithus albus]|nr:hypothetical protein EDD15DRAFT_1380783 [Pisolithus albus]
MYTFGSAAKTCSTDSANERAFENYRLVPRMLVDVSNRNIEVCNTSSGRGASIPDHHFRSDIPFAAPSSTSWRAGTSACGCQLAMASAAALVFPS